MQWHFLKNPLKTCLKLKKITSILLCIFEIIWVIYNRFEVNKFELGCYNGEIIIKIMYYAIYIYGWIQLVIYGMLFFV